MQRRALQFAILLAGLVPILGGGVGVVRGALAFGAWPGAGADSQARYLSGLLLGIGLAFWACMPTIVRRGREVRLLTLIVVVGGLARAAGWAMGHDPGAMRWTLAMELGVTPLLCLWQARLAARVSAPS
jgi:hypothetical protein